MKKIINCLIYLVALTAVESNASHIFGGFISYKYISPNTYLLQVTLVNECQSINYGDSLYVCCYAADSGVIVSAQLYKDSVILRPTNGCGFPFLTTCFGGFEMGLQVFFYSDTVQLPLQSHNWKFNFSDCCLNAAFNNVDGSTGMTLITTLDNISYPDNSSPVFNTIPFNEYCINQPSLIDFTSTDADGDSIVYQLANPITGSCTQGNVNLNYNQGYDSLHQVMSVIPQYFNANGLFYCVANYIQHTFFSFIIKEYRNGNLISTLMRNEAIPFVGLVQNADTISGRIYHDLNNNGNYNPGEPFLKNMVVRDEATNYMASNGLSGLYKMTVPMGNYIVKLNGFDTAYFAPDSQVVNFITTGVTSPNNNFGIYIPPGNADLKIELTNYSILLPFHQNQYQLHCGNYGGSTVYNPVIEFTTDTQFVFLSATPAPDSSNGNTFYFSFDSLKSLQSADITIVLDLPVLNYTYQYYSTCIIKPVVGDLIPANNFDTIKQVIYAPYDPNIKSVEPAGDVPVSFITDNNWLYYCIHFQNTGTASAKDVLVFDTVNANLNLSTIEFVSSSHPCIMNLTNVSYSRLVRFDFFNINLPDSFSNETLSHGFVKFRIKANTTLQAGDSVSNNAHIFFDTNPPVSTNTIVTHVTLAAGVENISLHSNSILFPNPVSDFAFIKLSEKLYSVKLSVYDLTGRLILQEHFANTDVIKLNATSIQNGIYVYCIDTQKFITKNKFVVQH